MSIGLPLAIARPPRAEPARRVVLGAELLRCLALPQVWTVETLSRAFAASGWAQTTVRRGIERLVAAGALDPFDPRQTQVPLKLRVEVAAGLQPGPGVDGVVTHVAAQAEAFVISRTEVMRRLMVHAFCVPDEHTLARLLRCVRDSGSAIGVESRAVVAALDELARTGQITVRTIGRDRYWRRTPAEAR